MPVLTWQTGDGVRTYTLGAETVIGRVAECDVNLAEAAVSRRHACIRQEGGTWWFEDLGSHNGSRINGERRTRWPCADGDVIEIGSFRIVYGAGMDRAPGTPDACCKPDDFSALASIDLSVAGAAAEARDSVDLQRRLHASCEIAKATAATLSVPDLLERVLGALFEIFNAADRGLVLVADQATGAIRRAASRQRCGDAGEEIKVSDTALERVWQTREAVLCLDTKDDCQLAASQSIVDIGIRSMMIAPLVYRDQVFGAIYLDALHRTAPFRSHDLQLLTVAAAEVAAALANAELHEQMLKQERMAAIGETVAGLSHCIKNILQGVKTGAYLVDLGLEQGDLERIGKGWTVVSKKNDFMEALVWDLLTLSKPREPVYEKTDLNALCEEVGEIGAAREDGGPGVTVAFHPDPGLPAVELDGKGMRRCLLNLVTNAVDACADGGAVNVSTHAPGDDGKVRVTVRDTGCGMDDETVARLFTVFFSTKGARGTGLGLPITKKIVEEHGGALEVASEKGRGTTFTVVLPARGAQG